jgi:hypothetical protein
MTAVGRKLPIRIRPLYVCLQYIRDLPVYVRNGKLGAGSGRLASANIRDHCTSGVAPKADVQNFSFNFRYVLKAVVPGPDSGRHFSIHSFLLVFGDIRLAGVVCI